jgi:hypothetical protein
VPVADPRAPLAVSWAKPIGGSGATTAARDDDSSFASRTHSPRGTPRSLVQLAVAIETEALRARVFTSVP